MAALRRQQGCLKRSRHKWLQPVSGVSPLSLSGALSLLLSASSIFAPPRAPLTPPPARMVSCRRHLSLSLSSSRPVSGYLSLVSPLSLLSLRGALPLALGLIYVRSLEDTSHTSCRHPLFLCLPLSLCLLPKASSLVAPRGHHWNPDLLAWCPDIALSLSQHCLRLLSCARRAPQSKVKNGRHDTVKRHLGCQAQAAPSRGQKPTRGLSSATWGVKCQLSHPVVLGHSWAVQRHLRRPEPSDAHWVSGGPVGERPRRRHLAAAAGDAPSDHAPNTAPRFPTWPSRDSAANFTSCCRAAFVASF